MSEAGTITKAELSDALFDQVGLNKREAKDLIDSFFETISASLDAGVDVKISGFGNFQLREKSARPGLVVLIFLLIGNCQNQRFLHPHQHPKKR